MFKQTHVYKVTVKELVNDKDCFIFGSLAAIYELFTPEQIGCKVERLWNYGVTEDKPYKSRKCTISKELLRRKKHKENKL